MIDEATYDELDRYFHANMNVDEKCAFEARVNSNAQLKEELLWLNTMLGSMKQQGRSVMKQTIASAIAGVPSSQVEKYKPSVRGKSFLGKYWWIVSVVVVAMVASIVIYKYTTQLVEAEGHNDDNVPQETIIPTDSGGVDSASEALFGPHSDSALKQDDDFAKKETVDVRFGGDLYLAEKRAKEVKSPEVAKNDSAIPVTLAYGYTLENDVELRDKTKPMHVITGYIREPPFTYSLGPDLTLNSQYKSVHGFGFQEVGDTVYMTDKEGVKYMLLRNRGVQLLVPMKIPQK